MTHVIVDSSYGNCAVYEATMENAMRLLQGSSNALDPLVVKLAKEGASSGSLIKKESVLRVVNAILTKEVGQDASKSIKVTDDLKKELVMYLYAKKVPFTDRGVSGHEFFKVFSLQDLSCFKNNENYPESALLVDEYVADQLHSYSVILHNKWKEGASEVAKIRYILNFISEELSSRDERYELCEVRASI